MIATFFLIASQAMTFTADRIAADPGAGPI